MVIYSLFKDKLNFLCRPRGLSICTRSLNCTCFLYCNGYSMAISSTKMVVTKVFQKLCTLTQFKFHNWEFWLFTDLKQRLLRKGMNRVAQQTHSTKGLLQEIKRYGYVLRSTSCPTIWIPAIITPRFNEVCYMTFKPHFPQASKFMWFLLSTF